MAAIPALKLTEGLWLRGDERPMLELIEEARANAVYNMYEEAELTGQYEFL